MPGKIRDEFMITRQGKQYVLYAGLLEEAHNQGLRSITTEGIVIKLHQDTGEPESAVIKAVVTMEDGTKFEGIGDAHASNVGRNIAPHVIRMAETRAKARALRDAINIGVTALEELSDGPTEQDDRRASSAPVREMPIRENQRTEILEILEAVGGDPQTFNTGIHAKFGKGLDELTATEAKRVLGGLKRQQRQAEEKAKSELAPA